MKIGLVTDSLKDQSFEEMLKTCKKMGIEQIELGVGNWSPAPHVNLDEWIESENKRNEIKSMLQEYDISISAFNCSGNPLAPGDRGRREDEVTRKCFQLSSLFGLDTVVMMSGLPAGGPEDRYPNWVVTSWPPETQEILDYQWNKVAIPYWKKLVGEAKKYGVKKLALEPHGCQLVHDVENFYRLREACGNDAAIGFNLDPSHLFWQGADPIAAARKLKEAIYHVHIKDIRVEMPSAVNTMLDGKDVHEYARRSWNFVIPGFGHDAHWWSKFIITLKMTGYDGTLSIEHEDYTMETIPAIQKTVNLLKSII